MSNYVRYCGALCNTFCNPPGLVVEFFSMTRNEELRALRRRGEKLAYLAARFHISEARVQQILRRDDPEWAVHLAATRAIRDARILELRAAGWTCRRIGRHVGLKACRVWRICKSATRATP